LGACLGGAGHGWTAAYRASICLPILIPLAGAAYVFRSTNAGRYFGRFICIAALAADAWLLLLSAQESLGYLGKAISVFPGFFLLWLVAWFGWQVAFGWLALRAARESSSCAP